MELYQLRLKTAGGPEYRVFSEKLIELLLGLAGARADAGDLSGAIEMVRKARATAATIDPGDRPAVEDKLRYLWARQDVEAEVAGLKTRLRDGRDNLAARKRLILLYVGELDDPAEARQYLNEHVDPDLRQVVELACRDAAGLTEVQAIQVAVWYESLAKTSVLAGEKMLAHARGAYQRYLAAGTASDADRHRATLALAAIERSLAIAAAAATQPAATRPAQEEWVDLLKLADPRKHALRGKWQRTKEGLSIEAEAGACLVLPMQPKGGYELQIDLLPDTGRGVVAVVLPVGPTAAELILGRKASGLRMVNRENYRSNPSSVQHGLEPGQVNTLLIRVTVSQRQADIGVLLNGRRLTRWKGPVSALSPGPFRMPDARAVGVGSHLRKVLFQIMRMRMLDGEAKLLSRRQDASSPAG